MRVLQQRVLLLICIILWSDTAFGAPAAEQDLKGAHGNGHDASRPRIQPHPKPAITLSSVHEQVHSSEQGAANRGSGPGKLHMNQIHLQQQQKHRAPGSDPSGEIVSNGAPLPRRQPAPTAASPSRVRSIMNDMPKAVASHETDPPLADVPKATSPTDSERAATDAERPVNTKPSSRSSVPALPLHSNGPAELVTAEVSQNESGIEYDDDVLAVEESTEEISPVIVAPHSLATSPSVDGSPEPSTTSPSPSKLAIPSPSSATPPQTTPAVTSTPTPELNSHAKPSGGKSLADSPNGKSSPSGGKLPPISTPSDKSPPTSAQSDKSPTSPSIDQSPPASAPSDKSPTSPPSGKSPSTSPPSGKSPSISPPSGKSPPTSPSGKSPPTSPLSGKSPPIAAPSESPTSPPSSRSPPISAPSNKSSSTPPQSGKSPSTSPSDKTPSTSPSSGKSLIGAPSDKSSPASPPSSKSPAVFTPVTAPSGKSPPAPSDKSPPISAPPHSTPPSSSILQSASNPPASPVPSFVSTPEESQHSHQTELHAGALPVAFASESANGGERAKEGGVADDRATQLSAGPEKQATELISEDKTASKVPNQIEPLKDEPVKEVAPGTPSAGMPGARLAADELEKESSTKMEFPETRETSEPQTKESKLAETGKVSEGQQLHEPKGPAAETERGLAEKEPVLKGGVDKTISKAVDNDKSVAIPDPTPRVILPPTPDRSPRTTIQNEQDQPEHDYVGDTTDVPQSEATHSSDVHEPSDRPERPEHTEQAPKPSNDDDDEDIAPVSRTTTLIESDGTLPIHAPGVREVDSLPSAAPPSLVSPSSPVYAPPIRTAEPVSDRPPARAAVAEVTKSDTIDDADVSDTSDSVADEEQTEPEDGQSEERDADKPPRHNDWPNRDESIITPESEAEPTVDDVVPLASEKRWKSYEDPVSSARSYGFFLVVAVLVLCAYAVYKVRAIMSPSGEDQDLVSPNGKEPILPVYNVVTSDSEDFDRNGNGNGRRKPKIRTKDF